MKKILFIFSIIFICSMGKAQNQNTSPYAPPYVTPGNQLPTQSGPPYNGSPTGGAPNTSYTFTSPGNTNTAPAVNTEEYNPSLPTVSPATPNTTTPNNIITPGNTVPNSVKNPNSVTSPQQFHRLFQDPVKTPKNPRVKTAGNVDGSNGKYVSEHKQPKSDFTKKKHHFKKAKHTNEKKGNIPSYTSTK